MQLPNDPAQPRTSGIAVGAASVSFRTVRTFLAFFTQIPIAQIHSYPKQHTIMCINIRRSGWAEEEVLEMPK